MTTDSSIPISSAVHVQTVTIPITERTRVRVVRSVPSTLDVVTHTDVKTTGPPVLWTSCSRP